MEKTKIAMPFRRRMVRSGPQQRGFRRTTRQGERTHSSYNLAHQSRTSGRSMTTQHGKLKIIPLSGLEEVGKNCTIIEYEKDIVVIDLGLMFPNEEMPGVDYVVPDVTYLEKNKRKIRGLVVTHGHMDHIGAIPYQLERIGNPPIYTMPLTASLIQTRQEEFKLDKKTKVHHIGVDDALRLGCFTLTFFRVTHSIPDSIGIAVHTPVGTVVHTGDFKIDHTPIDQKPTELHKIAVLSGKGILALLSDSTNSTKPGFAISEKKIGENLELLFRDATGRIIMSTFASLISRHQEIINAAIKHDRKVACAGYSLEKNITIAAELGYVNLPKSHYVRVQDINKYPDHKIAIICTGSQGQETSALGRMSRDEHKDVRLKKGDTVILSSSPIPGNERSVQNLMNALFRLGTKVVYNKLFGVHESGHGYEEDLRLMLALARPKHFIPIHGERHMLERHADLAQELGVKPENCHVVGNGNIIEFEKHTVAGRTRVVGKVLTAKVPAVPVMVDGLGVGDIGNVVLRDRQIMSQDGMFVIIVTVKRETLEIIGEPDIISRGFIYMRDNGQLISDAKKKVKKLLEDYTSVKNIQNWSSLRDNIRDELGGFLFQKTERRPMILPVIIEA